MEQLNHLFQKIESVNYQHREGGRYAYVQLMAYMRDLRNFMLKQKLALAEIPILQRAEALLNEMVHLRFEQAHHIVFEDKLRELSALKLRLTDYLADHHTVAFEDVA